MLSKVLSCGLHNSTSLFIVELKANILQKFLALTLNPNGRSMPKASVSHTFYPSTNFKQHSELYARGWYRA